MTSANLSLHRVRAWRGRADGEEYRVACLLAGALEASEDMLADLNARVWGDGWGKPESEAWLSLKNRTFVEKTQSGFRMDLSIARVLTTDLERDNPEAFRRVFQALADREANALESPSDSGKDADSLGENWYAAARLAYYLAPIAPSESEAQFGSSFLQAPESEHDARNWLIGLALTQQRYLSERPRILDFFRAFRDYQQGKGDAASAGFERVLSESEGDAFEAIAAHLWSVLNQSNSASSGRLERALDLSRTLGLQENFAMTANTIVYRLFARAETASQGARQVLLQNAFGLAAEAAGAADERGQVYIQLVTQQTLCMAEWLLATDHQTRQAPALLQNRLLNRLQRLMILFGRRGDNFGKLSALNSYLSILRDSGRFGEAIDFLSRNVPAEAEIWDEDARRILGKLLKTVGSISTKDLDHQRTIERDVVMRRLSSLRDEKSP